MKLLMILLVISLVLIFEAVCRKSRKKTGRPGRGKPKPISYGKYTEPGKSCPCWWDLTKHECGCCKNGGVQCGVPKQKYCYKKSTKGCPGVSRNKLTLSSAGFPCYWDHSDLSCAWCVPGTYQCAHGKRNKCENWKRGKSRSKCDGVLADCRHFGKQICDMNAECVEVNREGKKNLHACKCKEGWKGNGLQCIDADGNFGEDPNNIVQLEMTITNDFLVYPHSAGIFPYGPSQNNLFQVMEGIFNGGPTCSGCNATMLQLEVPQK